MWVWIKPKAPMISLRMTTYSHCFVMVGSKNGVELYLTFDLTFKTLTYILSQSGFSLIQHIPCQIIHISDKIISNVKKQIWSLHMQLHNHQLYVKEQPSQSYNICSVVSRINTEGNSFSYGIQHWNNWYCFPRTSARQSTV